MLSQLLDQRHHQPAAQLRRLRQGEHQESPQLLECNADSRTEAGVGANGNSSCCWKPEIGAAIANDQWKADFVSLLDFQ